MSKPEFPDDYYTDRDGLLEAYEGTGLRPYDSTEKRFYCDFCAVGIPYTKGERVGQYLVDHLPVNNTPKAKEINWRGQLAPLATYCTDCAQRLILFPCEGYTEVRLFTTIDEDQVCKEPEITDISPGDDGIPWDPADLHEQITGYPLEKYSAEDGTLFGPENVVTQFLTLNANLDIREIVNYEGEIDPQELGRARKAFDEQMKNYPSRTDFRDSVRSDTQ